MAATIGHWERRDTADRTAFGEAAFAMCKAMRKMDGIRSSRFFWVSPDRIAVLTEADSMDVFDAPPKPDAAGAIFALADLARAVDTERWIDPRDGQEAYRVAGR